VACLREVDYVIPFEIEDDQTVSQALRLLRPHVFTKGGDRVDNTNIPEWQVCQDLGIELVSQVGRPKLWSSSDFLKDWGEFWQERGTAGAAQTGQAGRKPASSLPTGSSQPGRRSAEPRQAPLPGSVQSAPGD
jgi:hypothetical protein